MWLIDCEAKVKGVERNQRLDQLVDVGSLVWFM